MLSTLKSCPIKSFLVDTELPSTLQMEMGVLLGQHPHLRDISLTGLLTLDVCMQEYIWIIRDSCSSETAGGGADVVNGISSCLKQNMSLTSLSLRGVEGKHIDVPGGIYRGTW